MRPQLIYCAEPTVAALVWNSTAVEAASVHGDRPSPVCLIPPWKVADLSDSLSLSLSLFLFLSLSLSLSQLLYTNSGSSKEDQLGAA